MKDKYILIHYDFICGEYEKCCHRVIKTTKRTKDENAIHQSFSDFYGKENLVKDEVQKARYYSYNLGDVTVKIQGYEVISTEQYLMLKDLGIAY